METRQAVSAGHCCPQPAGKDPGRSWRRSQSCGKNQKNAGPLNPQKAFLGAKSSGECGELLENSGEEDRKAA